MNLFWISVLFFFFGLPAQVGTQKVCDHAAPPPGMRWQCSETNSCDCHLVPRTGGKGFEEGQSAKPEAMACVACRIGYFVLPEYPEAARKEQKQGTVSGMVVLSASGEVEQVRIQSGDPVLASAVQLAFKQWRFAAGNREESIPVSVRFELTDRPVGVATGGSLLNSVIVARPMR